MGSSSIIYDEKLKIEIDYDRIKSNIQEELKEYLDLFKFDDNSRELSYRTEGPLIPHDNGKTPILLLLSNPHPHSVRQGMFLSPNRAGKENPFWNTLRGTGHFKHVNPITPSLMIKNQYNSPFRIFIAVLISFPSNFPHELTKIFGMNEYRRMIFSGQNKIQKMVTNHNIKNIICFGKTQYDIMASISSPKQYTYILRQGSIIQNNASFSRVVNVFLTFPTGWRFVKNSQDIKNKNLKQIMEFILQISSSR